MHTPVLLHEVIEGLHVRNGSRVIDATLNGGGHAREIISRILPNGFFLGIEWDQTILQRTQEDLRKEFSSYDQSRLQFVWSNYAQLEDICTQNHIECVDGLLADLGFSSHQIDDPNRGLSFMHDGPLDMRYDQSSDRPSAALIVNSFGEEAIGDILRVYGEEPYARKIAHAIVTERKHERFFTTRQFAELIERLVPRRRWQSLHPATKTFQALRIYVNGELDNLNTLLQIAPSLLASQGRIAIISFHSLEDRIVKHTFKQWEQQGIVRCITSRPIIPSAQELEQNPRARSAKLRVVEKI